ncbi:MAG: hypothetical protein ABF709_01370 [Leuconostoc pseudomesenteroides]|uniref:hypothetical protein n=1 Tax=Leuconostoc pseudomesenteroides TaxID=33968 RepID=UPI0039E9ACF2
MFIYLVAICAIISLVVLKALTLDAGSLADWVGALGTILSVGVAILVARKASSDNMHQARLDKSIDLYVDDLRTMVEYLAELEHCSFLDGLYRGGVRNLSIRERKEAEQGLIYRDDNYAEIIGYHNISTTVYKMPERKQKIFRPIINDISSDLNVVMKMDLSNEKFDDKLFIELLIKSVDNYGKIRDIISEELSKYSLFYD